MLARVKALSWNRLRIDKVRLLNLYKRTQRVTPRLARAPTIESPIRMAACLRRFHNPPGDSP